MTMAPPEDVESPCCESISTEEDEEEETRYLLPKSDWDDEGRARDLGYHYLRPNSSLVLRSLFVAIILFLLFWTRERSQRYIFSSDDSNYVDIDGHKSISDDMMMPETGEVKTNLESMSNGSVASFHDEATWNTSASEEGKPIEKDPITPDDQQLVYATDTVQPTGTQLRTVAPLHDKVEVTSINTSNGQESENEDTVPTANVTQMTAFELEPSGEEKSALVSFDGENTDPRTSEGEQSGPETKIFEIDQSENATRDENDLFETGSTPMFSSQDPGVTDSFETFHSDGNAFSTWDDPLDQDQVTFTEFDYQIHIVYDDWRYRRVCAPVGASSHLCMTVLHPFAFSPMDLSVDYASPTETRWYTTHKSPKIVVLESIDLEDCDEKTVKECLDHHFNLRQQPENENQALVVALFTKTFQGRTSLFGTTSVQQRQRTRTFFRNQVVVVFGASPSPPITECMKSLFGTQCEGSIIRVPHLANCTTSGFEEDWIIIEQDYFSPQDIDHSKNHTVLPGTSVNDQLFAIRDKLNLTWDQTMAPIRFTAIIEHPVAHTQNQHMLQNDWDYVVSLQNEWTHVFLDSFEDGPRKEELARQGLELVHVIAFDGSPQFFPTESGGYHNGIGNYVDEQTFLEKGGYDGWDPKYGSACTGPLHPTSNLTKLKDETQQAYERNGLNMRWYGRAWEFMNMFWFDISGWDGRRMDCTHAGKVNSPLSCMHKFFLMAMVDDYFDNVEADRVNDR